jgi:hypothetical protein
MRTKTKIDRIESMSRLFKKEVNNIFFLLSSSVNKIKEISENKRKSQNKTVYLLQKDSIPKYRNLFHFLQRKGQEIIRLTLRPRFETTPSRTWKTIKYREFNLRKK